jgi:hypothetical protein
MRRWDEEVQLLQEEFRRLPISLEHRAQVWTDRTKAMPFGSITAELAVGLVAYAEKQARMFRELAARARRIEQAPKLGRGKSRRREVKEYDPLVAQDEEDLDGEEDGDGERGEVDSDKELLMGGEVDDD